MVSWGEILLRLALATALGSIVGFERERGERSAGLRTHALVGLGAALFMSASAFGFGDVLGGRNIVLDPSRIAAQVASGIGFLGAGVIVFQRHIVRGLTTAASVWTVAAIGLASGAGMYLAAAGATILTLLVLAGMKPIERRWFRRRTAILQVVTERSPGALSTVRQAIETNSIEFQQLVVYPGSGGGPDRIELVNAAATGDQMNAAIDALSRLAGVREVRWRR
jgi:putative Mg2+ transporter-C (MgtC) family protein